MYLSFIKYLD